MALHKIKWNMTSQSVSRFISHWPVVFTPGWGIRVSTVEAAARETRSGKVNVVIFHSFAHLMLYRQTIHVRLKGRADLFSMLRSFTISLDACKCKFRFNVKHKGKKWHKILFNSKDFLRSPSTACYPTVHVAQHHQLDWATNWNHVVPTSFICSQPANIALFMFHALHSSMSIKRCRFGSFVDTQTQLASEKLNHQM